MSSRPSTRFAATGLAAFTILCPLPTTAAPGWLVDGAERVELLGAAVAAAGDVNGDGYDDLLVAAPFFDGPQGFNSGRVLFFAGTRDGPPAEPALTLYGPHARAEFGASIAAAGDVNGDGYDDLLVGAAGFGEDLRERGAALLYLGGPAGPADAPAWSVVGAQRDERLGQAVAAAGDVDGDGYDDLLVGSPRWDGDETDEGRVQLFSGAAAGPSTAPLWTRTGGQRWARLGESLAGAGDVNADGYDDVALGSPSKDFSDFNQGEVEVFLGSPSGPSAEPAWVTRGDDDLFLVGLAVAFPGDVNGDGHDDLLVAAADLVRLFAGTEDGPTDFPVWAVELRVEDLGGGDLDGDGLADAVLGAPGLGNLQRREGRALVFEGSPAGLRLRPDWTVESHQESSEFGAAVAVAGDVNGDGYEDLLVGSPRYDGAQSDAGRAWLYLGAAAKANPKAVCPSPLWTCACGGQGSVTGTLESRSRHPLGEPLVHRWTSALCAIDQPFSATTEADCPLYGTNRVELRVESGDLDDECAFSVKVLDDLAPVEHAPAAVVSGESEGTLFGWSVAFAGDVDGDGYDDVLVGEPHYGDELQGRALLYRGGAAGLSSAPAWSVKGSEARAVLGVTLAGAGDVNADGYDDVLVGQDAHGPLRVGRAQLFLGSSAGLGDASVWSHEGATGTVTLAAADVDGDGFRDVLVGYPRYIGQVLLFPGGPEGPADRPAWSASGEWTTSWLPPFFGESLDGAGDVNGDGYEDVLVGSFAYTGRFFAQGRAYVFLGGPTGPESTPVWIADGGQNEEWFGDAVAGAGDVDGDGFADVVVGATLYDHPDPGRGDDGRALLYPGGPGGPAAAPSWERVSDVRNNLYGRHVGGGGDVNGDGFADVIARRGGRVELFAGSARGLSPEPVWVAGEGGLFAPAGFGPMALDGDVNGDGYDDVLLAAAVRMPDGVLRRVVAVFLGRPGTGPAVPGGLPLPR